MDFLEDLSSNNVFAKLDFATLIRVVPLVSKKIKNRLNDILALKYELNLKTLKEIFLRLTSVYQNAVMRGEIGLLEAEWIRMPPYLRCSVEDNTLTLKQAREQHARLFDKAHFIDRLTIDKDFDLAVFENYFHTTFVILLSSELVRLVPDDRFNEFCRQSFHARDSDAARKIRFEFLNETMNQDLPQEAHVTMEEIVANIPGSFRELRRWMFLLTLAAHHARKNAFITRKDILTLPLNTLVMKILNFNLSLENQVDHFATNPVTGGVYERDVSSCSFLLDASMIYLIEQDILTFFNCNLRNQFFPLILTANCNEGLNTIGHTFFTASDEMRAYNGRQQQRMKRPTFQQILSLILERKEAYSAYRDDGYLWGNGDEYQLYNYFVARQLVRNAHLDLQNVLDCTLRRSSPMAGPEKKYFYTYTNMMDIDQESLDDASHPIDFDCKIPQLMDVYPLLLFSQRSLECFDAGVLTSFQAQKMSRAALASIIFQQREEIKVEPAKIQIQFQSNKESFDALVNEFDQSHPLRALPELENLYTLGGRFCLFSHPDLPFRKYDFPKNAPLPLQKTYLRAMETLVNLNKRQIGYNQTWINILPISSTHKHYELIKQLVDLIYTEPDLSLVFTKKHSLKIIASHKKAGAICKRLGNEKDQILILLKNIFEICYKYKGFPAHYNRTITEISNFIGAEFESYTASSNYRKESILKVDQNIVNDVHYQLLHLTNNFLASFKEKPDIISIEKHRIMTELQTILQGNNCKEEQLVSFADKLKLAQKNHNFYRHRDPAWKRYITNVIAIVLVIPALWLMINSYQNYNTCRFWLPNSQKFANYAEQHLQKLPGVMVA